VPCAPAGKALPSMWGRVIDLKARRDVGDRLP
jgi:hypothetical protein